MEMKTVAGAEVGLEAEAVVVEVAVVGDETGTVIETIHLPPKIMIAHHAVVGVGVTTTMTTDQRSQNVRSAVAADDAAVGTQTVTKSLHRLRVHLVKAVALVVTGNAKPATEREVRVPSKVEFLLGKTQSPG